MRMSPVSDQWISGHCEIHLYAALVQDLCHQIENYVNNLTYFIKHTFATIPKDYMKILKIPVLLLMFTETSSKDNLQLITLYKVKKLMKNNNALPTSKNRRLQHYPHWN